VKGLRLSAIRFNATGLNSILFSVYPELSRRLKIKKYEASKITEEAFILDLSQLKIQP
jgi:hypothetical protein